MSANPHIPAPGAIDTPASWRQGYPEEVLRSAWNPVVPMSRPTSLRRPSSAAPVPFTTPPIVVEGLPEATAA